jgi:tol-pal system protein YbgF
MTLKYQKHNVASPNLNIQKHPMRLLLLCVLSASLLNLAGCNLLGITPQQRRPSPIAKITAKPSASETVFQEQQKQLTARIDKLEGKIRLNQQDYQRRLKNMDQTISLLERNMVALKKNLKSVISASRKQPVAQSKGEKKVGVPSRKKATITSINSVPVKKRQTGEISTPLSSRAVETISLLKPNEAKKNRYVRKNKPKVKKILISGIEVKKKEKAKKPEYQGWEDPDLDTPRSPIWLKVVSGAKRRYQQAFKVYSSRNYSESVKHFNRFLIDFPDDQDADNSQFWVGQSHFQQENYLQAERAFRKVLRNYSHGTTREGYKTPDAALMIGRIYQIRKKPIKARYYFQQVITRYPDSRSAVKASREIDAMDSF